jgi:asparagine synthetase B (glutamine-hydrolysing)
MCSFLIYNFLVENISKYNYFLKFRGPDYTNTYNHNFKNLFFTFLHNLLNITGKIKYQPFVKNNIICLYNGEIYNHKLFGSFDSDGECIIYAYEKYNTNFCKYLNGEFAIVLFDFNKNIFILSTDIFATKPLWYNITDKYLGISSYKSGLLHPNLKNECIKLSANTILVYDIEKLKLLNESRIYNFNLKQYISNFNKWEIAFINSVKNRAYNCKYPVFVCLSGGYDSGLICATLNFLNIKYYTYTIIGRENKNILEKRIKLNKNKSCINSYIIDIDKQKFNEYKDYIKKNSEDFTLSFNPNNNNNIKLIDDDASIGMGVICKKASTLNHRIYLSGQGADEIISDYSIKGQKVYSNSNFSGIFPKDLNLIFPKNPKDKSCKWFSFYNYTQSSFLAKEEIISGLYGIEGRYPFLDKDVVQEYLNLIVELKNNDYKAPIKYLFDKLNYPYEEEKIGFNLNLKDHAVYFTEKKQIVSHSTNNNYGNILLEKYEVGDIIKLNKDDLNLELEITKKTIKNKKVIIYFDNILNKELFKNRRNWIIIK